MKMYSDDAVTRQDLQNIQLGIDSKQNRQLRTLRIWVAVGFVVNLAVSGLVFIYA